MYVAIAISKEEEKSAHTCVRSVSLEPLRALSESREHRQEDVGLHCEAGCGECLRRIVKRSVSVQATIRRGHHRNRARVSRTEWRVSNDTCDSRAQYAIAGDAARGADAGSRKCEEEASGEEEKEEDETVRQRMRQTFARRGVRRCNASQN